jgi:quercetin dioxygenase-like cupin family protein
MSSFSVARSAGRSGINSEHRNNHDYLHPILDLAKEAEPPADGILSRTIFQDDKIKAVAFGFAQDQELSEHTAAKPAMLFFVKGEASVGLGDDVQEAQAGSWVHMPAKYDFAPNCPDLVASVETVVPS